MLGYDARQQDDGLRQTVIMHANQHKGKNGHNTYLKGVLESYITLLEKVIIQTKHGQK